MRLLLHIALTHLRTRSRQTVLAMLGVALGVGFSIAMAALMQGTQNDFVESLIDAMPHVLVSDEQRAAPRQPAENVFAAVAFSGLRPKDDVRGIRNPTAAVAGLRGWLPGRLAADLPLQAVARYAGRDTGLMLLGITPEDEAGVSSLGEDMTVGGLANLATDASGIVIGDGVAKKLGVELGDGILVTSSANIARRFKVVGLFHTGVTAQDDGQGYVLLKTAQILAGRPDAIGQIRVRLDDAMAAREVATRIERQIGYKAVSWQEQHESLLEAFFIRNVIMYTVVGAILLVAGFGIFNIVSTIIHEKARDIAIMKSLGFAEADMRRLFLIEGLVIGLMGSILGGLLGFGLTVLLGSLPFEIKEATEMTHLPMAYAPLHYLIASACAMGSAGVAGYLPARRAARLNPVDIIRGAA